MKRKKAKASGFFFFTLDSVSTIQYTTASCFADAVAMAIGVRPTIKKIWKENHSSDNEGEKKFMHGTRSCVRFVDCGNDWKCVHLA